MLTEEEKTEIGRLVESRLLELLKGSWSSEVKQPESAEHMWPVRELMADLERGLRRQLLDSLEDTPIAANASPSPTSLETKPILEPFVRVIARAIEVLGSSEKALRWLETPVRSLGDQPPVSLLGTPEGRARVEDVLGRIEHGVW